MSILEEGKKTYLLQQYTFVATVFHIFWNTDAKEISVPKANAEITQLWIRVLIYIWLFFPFLDSTFGHFCLDFSAVGHFFWWPLSPSFLHLSDEELWRRAFLLSLWRRANARNVTLLTLYGGQFTLSTPYITLNDPVILSHWRSTTVTLETHTLNSLGFFVVAYIKCYLKYQEKAPKEAIVCGSSI